MLQNLKENCYRPHGSVWRLLKHIISNKYCVRILNKRLFLTIFQVVHDILPMLAKSRVDRLISIAQDAQYRLELVPSTTVEFVESLTFLEEIQVSIDNYEKESETIKELF